MGKKKKESQKEEKAAGQAKKSNFTQRSAVRINQ